MSDETQRRIAQNQSDYAALLAENAALREALTQIANLPVLAIHNKYAWISISSAALAAASPTPRKQT